MPDHKTYFITCNSCGHKKSAFLIFRDNNLLDDSNRPKLKEIKNYTNRMICSKCGVKDIRLTTKKAKYGIQYVATSQSGDRVFHRSTCGWMKNVSLNSEIIFQSRDYAIKKGYSPCKSCRP